jgi:hypothetical protein
MKKIFMCAAVATVLASPAFAQSYSPGYGTGNLVNLPALEHRGGESANGSFAYEPPHATRRQLRGIRGEALSPADRDTVYESGQYIGRDPDPNVRLELRRDWTHD